MGTLENPEDVAHRNQTIQTVALEIAAKLIVLTGQANRIYEPA